MRQGRPFRLAAWSLVIAACTGPAWSSASNALSPELALLRSAQMWEAKNRPDIARQLLDKALLLNPDSPEVQAQHAELALRANKLDEARKVLDKLQARFPQHPVTRDLALLIQVQTQGREKLAAMRLMARAGRKAEAAELARELFPNGPPVLGGLALEYHQLVGVGSDGGDWQATERRLRRLHQETGDARYWLAAIETRLNQASASTAMLKELEAVARQPGVNPQAVQELWRKAIDRLVPGPDSIPWIRAFVQRFPNDTAMVEALAAAQEQAERAERLARDPAYVAARTGQAALDKGDLDTAESQLQRAIQLRPRDADSLGSLGLIRLRQGRHAQAQELFQLANQITPQRRWTDLLITARLWGSIRAAEQALNDKDLPRAETLARQALTIDPANADAILALAGVLSLTEKADEAEALYQQVMGREPGNVAAILGLATLQARQGQQEKALALLDAAAQREPALAQRLAAPRAQWLREQAEAWLSAQRISPALRAFEAAVVLTPDDAWLRHALARLYLRLEQPRQAVDVMNEGVQYRPQDPEMRYARALIRSAVNDDVGALADLDGIAPDQLSDGMRSLRQSAGVQLRVAQALQTDQPTEAAALLHAAEAWAEQEPDLLYAVANAWFKRNQPALGLAVFDRLARRQPKWPPSVALDYATLLGRAQMDEVLVPLLTQLLGRTDWTAEQEERLLTLYAEVQERAIERQQRAGHPKRADALAQQALPATRQVTPLTQTRLRARLLLAAQRYAQALPLWQEVVQQVPDDLDARLEVADALARLGRVDEAREQVRKVEPQLDATDLNQRLALLRLWQRLDATPEAQALARSLLDAHPEDSDVLQHAARLERALGNYGQAVQYFKRALQLELASRQTLLASGEPAAQALEASAETGARPGLRLAYAITPRSLPEVVSQVVSDAPATSGLADGPLGDLSLHWMPLLRSAEGVTLAAMDERGPGQPSQALVSGPVDAGLDKLKADIEAIEARRQSWVESGLQRLQKRSTDGISSLRGWEWSNVLWIPGSSYDGPYFVRLDRVSLDAGALPANVDDVLTFGQVGANDPSRYGMGGSRDALRGTHVAIGREMDRWRWDVGIAGLGLPVTNVVGGLSYSRYDEHGGHYIEASRRMMTGSVLSYAGARDPITGKVWGGVVATGVQARRSVNLGNYSVSGSASYTLLTGQEVRSNTRLQLRVGVDRDLLQTDGQRVNLGLALSLWRHAHDLSEYSWGHGGYYSPQRYLSLSLPVEWTGRSDAWTWQVRASASLSRSSSDAAPWYPTDSALQSAAVAAGQPAQYRAFNSTGHGYALRAVLERQLASQWVLGARLELDRSAYYAPTNLMVYARYRFAPVVAPLVDRPMPVQPYAGF